MKCLFVLIPLACGAMLGAQCPEVQLAFGQTKLRSLDVSSTSASLSVDPASQTGGSLRAALDWPLQGPWSIEGSLGYRFRSSGKLDYHTTQGLSGTLDVKEVLERQVALGALVRWHGPVILGAGLDLRREDLKAEAGPLASSGNLTRPWVRMFVRHGFTSAPWHPFVGIECSLPLTRETPSGTDYIRDLDLLGEPGNPSAGSVAKAHAPTFEVVVSFGVRFSNLAN